MLISKLIRLSFYTLVILVADYSYSSVKENDVSILFPWSIDTCGLHSDKDQKSNLNSCSIPLPSSIITDSPLYNFGENSRLKDKFKLFSIRFDSNSLRVTNQKGLELRLVFEQRSPQGTDTSLHLVYFIKKHNSLVKDLKYLMALNTSKGHLQTGPNSQLNYKGNYYNGLISFLEKYSLVSNLIEVAHSKLGGRLAKNWWVFSTFLKNSEGVWFSKKFGSNLNSDSPFLGSGNILSAVKEQEINFSNPKDYTVLSNTKKDVEEFVLSGVFSDSKNIFSKDNAEAAVSLAIKLEDTNKTHINNTDCVSCHLSGVLRYRSSSFLSNSQMFLNKVPSSSIYAYGAFSNEKPTGTFGSMRMFGYTNRYGSKNEAYATIAPRVYIETIQSLKMMNDFLK